MRNTCVLGRITEGAAKAALAAMLIVLWHIASAQNPTVDDFNPGASDIVSTLAVQADGKVLVGGSFTTLGGQPRNRIGRLNADGTLDNGFNPGASSSVYVLAPQPDGKVLVGGSFTTLGGQARSFLGRVNRYGSLDSGFNPGLNGPVLSLEVQADGKILLGGRFTTLAGQSRLRIGRINADGTLDSTFNPGVSGSSPEVGALAVQADGRIVVGGYFRWIRRAAAQSFGSA